jgi:hypothetical protein
MSPQFLRRFRWTAWEGAIVGIKAMQRSHCVAGLHSLQGRLTGGRKTPISVIIGIYLGCVLGPYTKTRRGFHWYPPPNALRYMGADRQVQ